MSGDRLSLLLFLVGTSVAGVMGALTTHGWRSRSLWSAAVFFAVAALVYLQAESRSPAMAALLTLWSLAPVIGVTMVIIVMSGRAQKPTPPTPVAKLLEKPEDPKPEVGKLNPALTTDYLNELITGRTKLDAKRRLAPHVGERARLKGHVADITEGHRGKTVDVRMGGLVRKYGHYSSDVMICEFRPDQAHALAAIKPNDWIEFIGAVAEDSHWGWTMKDCEFAGRVDDPRPEAQPARPRRRRTSQAGKA